MTRRIRAGMPWAFISIVLVFGFGVIIFRFFGPHVEMLLQTASDLSNRQASSKGIATLNTIWQYWPLWFVGALMVFGFVEAVRRSSPGGGGF